MNSATQVDALRRDVIVAIEPRAVGLEVAAQLYGISAETIAHLQATRGFPVLRVGRRRLVPIAQADAWITAESARQTGATP